VGGGRWIESEQNGAGGGGDGEKSEGDGKRFKRSQG